MRIVFICGSLEGGKDGVADYTMKLASELYKQGHQVSAIALNDRYTTELIIMDGIVINVEIPILRIPSIWSEKGKLEKSNEWIDNFKPDFLSLQFVVFAFHPKGLPFGLCNLLSELRSGRKWHIMFHELWVGMAQNESLKRMLWGKLQRWLIKRLVRTLKPIVIHTNCNLFLHKLEKERYPVKKLPLFSNIDVERIDSFLKAELQFNFEDKTELKIVVFGGVHPEAKLMEFILLLKGFELKHNKRFIILYIGRNGFELNKHIDLLQSEKVNFRVFGELEPKQISYILSSSDCGLSTGSPQMLDKNGTVAAMLAHQLPIICIGRNLIIRDSFKMKTIDGIYLLNEIDEVLLNSPTIAPSHTASEIATRFINDLNLKS